MSRPEAPDTLLPAGKRHCWSKPGPVATSWRSSGSCSLSCTVPTRLAGVGSGCGERRGCPRDKPLFLGAAQRLGERRALGSRACSSRCAQVDAWLREKNLVVLEEGWQDPAGLQAQLRRPQNLQVQDTSVHHQQRLQTVRSWGPGRGLQARAGGDPTEPWQLALNHSRGWPTFECFLHTDAVLSTKGP